MGFVSCYVAVAYIADIFDLDGQDECEATPRALKPEDMVVIQKDGQV